MQTEKNKHITPQQLYHRNPPLPKLNFQKMKWENVIWNNQLIFFICWCQKLKFQFTRLVL